ncbi:hypothetical protein KKF34_18825 [Myxococcota bacterium]|nr:hypothetical protein [Myxococcota bacterium]MBU1380807.1 hypothetical protein [Myxococcota bacterium]MBU1498941.1 hypothetical protein [Myxococcota bacterium]
MKKLLFISLTLFAAIFSTDAQSQMRKIFINGIDLSKYLITNVELKNVTVKFDAKGNIYIVAQGYNIKPGEKVKTETKESDEKLANKYYLVTFPKPAKGSSGYDVDLLVNGKFVKRLYADSDQLVLDVTEHVKKGKNLFSFISKKSKIFKGKATGSMRYAIARGYESKGTYVIKNIIWEITRKSTDTKESYIDKKEMTIK